MTEEVASVVDSILACDWSEKLILVMKYVGPRIEGPLTGKAQARNAMKIPFGDIDGRRPRHLRHRKTRTARAQWSPSLGGQSSSGPVFGASVAKTILYPQ